MSSIYPTRTPDTTANIEAFLADAIAKKRVAPAMLPARVKLRLTSGSKAHIVERMAEDMRTFGEGMTEKDLIRLGYPIEIIRICAEAANQKAMARALN